MYFWIIDVEITKGVFVDKESYTFELEFQKDLMLAFLGVDWKYTEINKCLGLITLLYSEQVYAIHIVVEKQLIVVTKVNIINFLQYLYKNYEIKSPLLNEGCDDFIGIEFLEDLERLYYNFRYSTTLNYNITLSPLRTSNNFYIVGVPITYTNGSKDYRYSYSCYVDNHYYYKDICEKDEILLLKNLGVPFHYLSNETLNKFFYGTSNSSKLKLLGVPYICIQNVIFKEEQVLRLILQPRLEDNTKMQMDSIYVQMYDRLERIGVIHKKVADMRYERSGNAVIVVLPLCKEIKQGLFQNIAKG